MLWCPNVQADKRRQHRALFDSMQITRKPDDAQMTVFVGFGSIVLTFVRVFVLTTTSPSFLVCVRVLVWTLVAVRVFVILTFLGSGNASRLVLPTELQKVSANDRAATTVSEYHN